MDNYAGSQGEAVQWMQRRQRPHSTQRVYEVVKTLENGQPRLIWERKWRTSGSGRARWRPVTLWQSYLSQLFRRRWHARVNFVAISYSLNRCESYQLSRWHSWRHEDEWTASTMTFIWKMVMSSCLPLLNDLTVISVSFFHHVQDRRQGMGSISHLSQSSRECYQTYRGIFKSKRECFYIIRRCRRANLLPLTVVKSATPPPASVTTSPLWITASSASAGSRRFRMHVFSRLQVLKRSCT